MRSRSKKSLERLALLADAKFGFREDEAEFVVGSPQLLHEMVAAKWIKPVVHRHKLVIFDRGDLSRAWARILNGEQPPRLVRATPKNSRNHSEVGPANAERPAKSISAKAAGNSAAGRSCGTVASSNKNRAL